MINFYFGKVWTTSKTLWSLLTAYFESLLFDHFVEELRLRSFVGSFYNSGAKERSWDEGQNEEPLLGYFGWRGWNLICVFQFPRQWILEDRTKAAKISTEKNDFVGDDRS